MCTAKKKARKVQLVWKEPTQGFSLALLLPGSSTLSLSQKEQRGAFQHPKPVALGETGPSAPAVTR
jgi:hypothetical protein